MQKTPLRNPTPTLNQLLMHQRNLTSRATKTDEAQFKPEQKCLPKARCGWS
jgi:hypothetical protein